MTTTTNMEFTTQYLASIIETAIAGIQYPNLAPRLFDPVRYTLSGGGKRLRPCLTLAAYSALSGDDINNALPQALAIEMFHNFTLLHDDVMDRADLRRGRPTVHRRWNDNVAIISGDTMLTAAVQLLAQCQPKFLPAVLKLFNDTAMEVYQGQQLDMEFEKRQDVSIDEYIDMIRLKTSVLLACACATGAIMAQAAESDINAFYRYGLALGLAFQLRDDWLDTYGDPAVFGKEIGGDIINRKKTWLFITALAEDGDNLREILAGNPDNATLIRQVRQVYDKLELSQRCMDLATKYSTDAAGHLRNIKMPEQAREFFASIAAQSASRTH